MSGSVFWLYRFVRQMSNLVHSSNHTHQSHKLTRFILNELVNFGPTENSTSSYNQGRSFSRELKNQIAQAKKISELSTDAQTVFNFACLIVDIKYKHQYGKKYEWQDGRGYKIGINPEEIESKN